MPAHRVESLELAGGWHVRSETTAIVPRERIEQVEASTGAPTTPEMLFDSSLTFTHAESGVTLSFNAEDALREWVEAKGEVIKVAAAATWTRAHVERFGDGPAPASAAAQRDGDEVADDTKARAPPPSSAAWNSTETSTSYDWTFTTPYGGSVSVSPARAAPAPTWEPTSLRIDRAMLTERDPIQLYDELTLYESELDDNGVARLALKVRAMPKCWFVLLRFWLRVDGVRVRLRETRFFCDVTQRDKTGAVCVVRETQLRDETWDELRARGAPSAPSQYPDCDQAASVLLAAGGPVRIDTHALHLTRELARII
jgi:type 2A phosphatase activator TIP41